MGRPLSLSHALAVALGDLPLMVLLMLEFLMTRNVGMLEWASSQPLYPLYRLDRRDESETKGEERTR